MEFIVITMIPLIATPILTLIAKQIMTEGLDLVLTYKDTVDAVEVMEAIYVT